MTDPSGPSVQSGAGGGEGYVERREGAKRKVGDVPYVELLEHSTKLGRIGNWEGSKAFTTAGVLFLGAGLGALATDATIVDVGVILCLSIGAILLLASLFIRRARVDSIENVKADFDRVLSWYEHDPELREMREQYGGDPAELPSDASFWQRTRRFLRL